MVSLLKMSKTERLYPVSVFEIEGSRRGKWRFVPKIHRKKWLLFVGRLTVPDILLLDLGWYDYLLDPYCREVMLKGLWTIMMSAKLNNHKIIEWYTRRQKEATIIIHVVRDLRPVTVIEE